QQTTRPQRQIEQTKNNGKDAVDEITERLRTRTTFPQVVLPTVRQEDLEQYVRHENFITKKEYDDLELAIKLREQGKITTPGRPFEESMRSELDSLIAKGVFEFVVYN